MDINSERFTRKKMTQLFMPGHNSMNVYSDQNSITRILQECSVLVLPGANFFLCQKPLRIRYVENQKTLFDGILGKTGASFK